MFDLSLAQVLVRIVAFIVLTGVHGVLIAGLARLLGDRGPAYDGRLTPNPFTHLDIIGLVAAVVTRTGWIRPLSVDPAQLKGGRFGLLAIVLLALLLTIGFGAIALGLRTPTLQIMPLTYANYVLLVLNAIAEMSVWFALFNLIPLPPLTGGLILLAIAPWVHAVVLRHAMWVGLGLAAIMLLTRGAFLQPFAQPIIAFLLR
ncbi:hypothetical protein EMQ25_09265 [Arsenicitalea aurantiaca]|uniref:Site-2 protease family protein n=1 Tax=Arsenicitalea aurantiaca TaxID=1783274 RepID=A0A433XAM6_9HYPH|nr:hypothetical protein [Arsenicitalea aurantiaca]RUT31058.1 hypothetical protein EMQ25_09265 [Arsenicitalea aurantiaca]